MEIDSPLGARIVSVEELFRMGVFVPAAVQRDFQWEHANITSLLSDLDRAFGVGSTEEAEANAGGINEEETEDEHMDRLNTSVGSQNPAALTPDYYLGAMVIRRLPEEVFQVFDGLQRITALTILLCVIRDISTSASGDRIDSLIARDGQEYRVRLAGRDRTLPQQVQKRGEAVKSRHSATSDMGKRIRSAARHYRDVMRQWDDIRLTAFVERVLGKARITLVESSDERLARQIFVTTNMRGLQLDRVDLMKGQLMDIAEEESRSDAILIQWDALRTTMGKDLEELLILVDFVERRQPQGPGCLTDLAEHISHSYGSAGVVGWMTRLADFGAAWREMKVLMDAPGISPGAIDIWRLRLIAWDEWKPLGLLWYHSYYQQRDPRSSAGVRARDKMATRFANLHRRCMAITLAGYSDSDRAKIFANAISQTANRHNVFRAGKTNRGALTFNDAAQLKMRQALHRPLSDDDARVILRWLDTTMWHNRPPEHIQRATLEHVLPERVDPLSQWVKDFPDEEARYLSCFSLGNMTLLSRPDNLKAGNDDFSKNS